MTTKGRLTAEFFAENRRRLVEAQPSSIIVLAGNSEMQSRGDAAFNFTQESNFWWLTGLERADYWLIIDGKSNKTYLVSPPVDEVRQIFDGSLDTAEIEAVSGIGEVLSNDDGVSMLQSLARTHSLAYGLGADPSDKYYHFVKNPAQTQMWHRLERTFNSVSDIRSAIAKLRSIKQPSEIAAIKRAIRLTSDAFEHVYKRLPELTYEYEVEAEFSYYFRRHGAQGHAYDPIVAGAKNACTLHYGSNNAKLKKGSMLLLDIGARVDGYAADITRTYAYGSPSKSQLDLHSAVTAAHHEIIALLGPGVSVGEYHRQVDEIMKRTLVGLKLIKSPDDEAGYRKYFPHAISHGLGVDVHDSLGRPEVFQPGMVLTVEPGIYIPESGVGVRIEDDILITDNGYENLSRSLSTDC